jgi:hypothetical protein
LVGYAQLLHLGVPRFITDLKTHAHAKRIREDFLSGVRSLQPGAILLRCRVRTVLWLQPAWCETFSRGDLELVAPGHDGRCQSAL